MRQRECTYKLVLFFLNTRSELFVSYVSPLRCGNCAVNVSEGRYGRYSVLTAGCLSYHKQIYL